MKIVLNENIEILDNSKKKHLKASEEYIHVKFTYPNKTWEGWVPTEYRRTGVSIKTEEELETLLQYVYDQMNPANFEQWMNAQKEFWGIKKAKITKPFFDSLVKGEWQCVACTLPKNPNFARRIQDLKEFGYTLATDTNRYCPNCKAKKTHILLLPIPRGISDGNGYETFSPKLRIKIIKALGAIDVYENRKNLHTLPDHKFSEIRWDESTKSVNLDTMDDTQIRQKFQLLSNQRNQQKREVCRACFQSNKRSYPFGIKFYYKGTENWETSIPKKGSNAEDGCIGCGWYDLAKWREELNKIINTQTTNDN